MEEKVLPSGASVVGIFSEDGYKICEAICYNSEKTSSDLYFAGYPLMIVYKILNKDIIVSLYSNRAIGIIDPIGISKHFSGTEDGFTLYFGGDNPEAAKFVYNLIFNNKIILSD